MVFFGGGGSGNFQSLAQLSIFISFYGSFFLAVSYRVLIQVLDVSGALPRAKKKRDSAAGTNFILSVSLSLSLSGEAVKGPGGGAIKRTRRGRNFQVTHK